MEKQTTVNVPSSRDEAYWAKPVRTLTVRTVPADAVNANVAGRRVAGAAQGFGQLWHKRFRVRLDGARVSPQEVIRVWKDRFGDFWPKGARVFLPAAGIAPGEIGLINAGVPGAPTFATGILVIYADDVSFSFISPEGHPFTGPITFSAFNDDGTTVAEVEEFTRASDPLWELLMILPFVGGKIQNAQWVGTLGNLAAHWGAAADVETRIVCLDRRRQWSQAKNVWHNAGIHSAIHAIGAPLRRVARRVD